MQIIKHPGYMISKKRKWDFYVFIFLRKLNFFPTIPLRIFHLS